MIVLVTNTHIYPQSTQLQCLMLRSILLTHCYLSHSCRHNLISSQLNSWLGLLQMTHSLSLSTRISLHRMAIRGGQSSQDCSSQCRRRRPPSRPGTANYSPETEQTEKTMQSLPFAISQVHLRKLLSCDHLLCDFPRLGLQLIKGRL